MFATRSLIAAAAAATFSFAATAAPVSLGSIEHLYGSGAGRQLSSIMSIYHPGGNCDTAAAAAITVKATSASSCNRFADVFDFSGIDYDSIDHLVLTLSFTGAKNQVFGLESWSVRGASNYVESANTLGALNANGPQSFIFDDSRSLFDNVVDAEKFVVMFSTNSGSSMNFDLASAKLEVFGTAAVAEVPEPGSLALVAAAGLALLVAGRRRA